ncbi:methyltransferase [Candidatus Latescibacterota bacterium]
MSFIINGSVRFSGGHGFRAHSILFAVLAIIRIISVVLAGLVDYGSVSVHWSISWILAPAITLLVVYSFYSTFRYFGYERAVGADHFFPEYRTKQFVRKGIFKYSSNSMYTFAMLFLFIIGILCESKAAIYLAGYHYLTAWAHYFCTEKPDIKAIYGEDR